MQTFTRHERFSGRKNFEVLFSKGNSFFLHPFRVIWMKAPDEQQFPVRIAFGVPKRNFKSAVKRNRIKRLMREAYRLYKQELYGKPELKSVKIVVLIVYSGRELPEFNGLQDKIILSLNRLLQTIDGAGKHT